MSEPTQEPESKEIVLLKSKAYKDILLHSSRYCNQNIPRNQWKEVYGFLVGTLKGDDVTVEEAIPMTHGGTTEVQFEEKHYIEAAELDSKLAVDGKFFIVGWYHSHPGLNLFLSSVDVHNHMGFQGPNPKSIALVCDPTKIAVAGHSGFEIFKLKEISPTSSYYTIGWKIPDSDHLFLGRTLFELAERSTAHRPVIQEYGEPDTTVSVQSNTSVPAQKIEVAANATPVSVDEPEIVVVTPDPQVDVKESLEIQEKLAKASRLAEDGEYERAIDLALTLAQDLEDENKEGLASDAFLQVGGFFYDFWNKIYEIRGKIFSHQRDPTKDDIEKVITLAKLLNFTKKRVDFVKIGLELEIRNLTGEMTKINNVDVQIANILLEASEICTILANNANKNKNLKAQIIHLQYACEILRTVEGFIHKMKIKSDLIKNIFNINQILNKKFFNRARILELKGQLKIVEIDHVSASKYFVGASIISRDGSQKINDETLKNNLTGYAETLMGRGFLSLGEKEYFEKNFCKANGYYDAAKGYFEQAKNLYPLHAKWDNDRNKYFIEESSKQYAKSQGKCIDSKGKITKLDKKELELKSSIDLKDLEPIFYP